MAQDFTLTGIKDFSELADKFGKEVQRQVDLASKQGINKSSDLITYGRVSGISAESVKNDSAVGRAARLLRIPKEHIFYRTFIRGIKVSHGKGRGAKPYASTMMRSNSINVADLLATGSNAKSMYGFITRKKNTSGKKYPNLKAQALAARQGNRKSSRVKIAGKTYENSYIGDGATRNRSEAMNRHYIKNLGADPKRKLKGRRYFVFQKRNLSQLKPYPAKAIKISATFVKRATETAASYAINTYGSRIADLQTKEVNKKLKKLGFTLK